MIITQTRQRREHLDEWTGRVLKTEFRCSGCGCWLDEDEVVWIDTETGEASWLRGTPFCVRCARAAED